MILLVLGALAVSVTLLVQTCQRSEQEQDQTLIVSSNPSPLRAEHALLPDSAADSAAAKFGLPPLEATTPEEVREVLRFTREATGDDLPTLRDMALRAEDPLVAGNAIRALGRMGAVAEDPKLVALIEDTRQRVRQEIVVALGLSGSASAVPLLAGVLESTGERSADDDSLRLLAVRALGYIGGERAHDILAAVRDDPNATKAERVFAEEALCTPPAPKIVPLPVQHPTTIASEPASK